MESRKEIYVSPKVEEKEKIKLENIIKCFDTIEEEKK